MKTLLKPWMSLMLIVLFALAPAACGGDEGEDSAVETDDVGDDDTGGDNGGGNDTGGGGTTDTTCAEMCTQLLSVCPPEDGVDQTSCESGCQSNINQATRNCIAGASTCADATACIESGGDNGGGNNDGDEGAIGSTCIDGTECDSALCKLPAGGFEGQCVQNDLGEICDGPSECVHGRCLARPDDDRGFCSISCTDDDACPFGWSCVESANATADYCEPDA